MYKPTPYRNTLRNGVCSGDGCTDGANLKIVRYNGYPPEKCSRFEFLGTYVPREHYTSSCGPLRDCAGNSLSDFSKCKKIPQPSPCTGFGLSSRDLMFPSQWGCDTACGCGSKQVARALCNHNKTVAGRKPGLCNTCRQ